MASEGSEENRAKAVSEVASRLFGADIGQDAVIDESLQRVTNEEVGLDQAKLGLATKNEKCVWV